MVSLLMISFILHLITLAAIFQLLKKVQQMENMSNSNELTAALERSLEEIKAENDRLQTLMTNQKQVKKDDQDNTIDEPADEKVPTNETQPVEKEDVDHLIGDAPGYKVEASLESRVMQLYAKGLTIEEIAKTLDCGKTEAELITRLYNK
ncbi:DUF2802 domain-containing protein [Oceanobacillus alkalisoli]|uniref:DUF2802 domain-containing protein n=1 Tax=Oceanobacillus alkalisoli TaxID=2925113 RepID=UPI001EEF842F|nr:DUF2802 domain-containing protein [Oceanobacillus alkalisoli]MCF3942406.1 DUF2802 domain-containing protein [Oceanobacillus alkalisoli]MCG5103463.1 DUF2802 domain-containing protein [Oceanobacillus alkalisoli]